MLLSPIAWFESSETKYHPDFVAVFELPFSPLLSFFPPRSNSRWPALVARDFSVISVRPAECFYKDIS